jgi:mannose-1-phosphate guanylyltransferase
VRGLVLAAGFGTRLKPLSEHLTKALVSVCGQPLLQRTLSMLASQGVGPLAVNTHHLHEQVEQFRGVCPHAFSVSHEADRIRGTGGALAFAAEFLRQGSDFLVCNAEPVKVVDLQPLVQQFRSSGAACGLVCVPVARDGTMFSDKQTGEYAGTRADTIDRSAVSHGLFLGIGMYRREFLGLLKPDDFSIVPVWRRAQNAGMRVRVLYTLADTYWRDVGTPAELALVHLDSCEGRSPYPLVAGLARDAARGLVHPDSLLPDTVARLGHTSWIEEPSMPPGATFERTVVLHGARLESGRQYRDTIITPWGEMPFGATHR